MPNAVVFCAATLFACAAHAIELDGYATATVSTGSAGSSGSYAASAGSTGSAGSYAASAGSTGSHASTGATGSTVLVAKRGIGRRIVLAPLRVVRGAARVAVAPLRAIRQRAAYRRSIRAAAACPTCGH